MSVYPWWTKYPYQNDEVLNLDWLLTQVTENTEDLADFINLNTIKYADPIEWDITSQYEANTIVVDPQTGDAYISTTAVPYGVALSNTDYWTVIYNYTDAINNLQEQIAIANEELSTTATDTRAIGDLVWLNGELYEVTAAMIVGDSYVENSNCIKTTVEEYVNTRFTTINETLAYMGDLDDLDTTDKTTLVNAINEVLSTISDITGDLDDLDTTDKTTLVNAINEVLTTISDITGNLDDLNTSVTTDLVAAINSELADRITADNNILSTINSLRLTSSTLELNSILETTTTGDGGLQGGCYIGDNLYVYYEMSDQENNNGDLVCIDLDTYTESWRYTLQLYHGNSITYRSADNSLYINKCFGYGESDLSPTVFRIDLDDPSTIAETITAERDIYAFAYNDDTDRFYALCYRGTTDGEANRVFVFNTSFEVTDYFDLEDYPSVLYSQSSQGIQLIVDNVIYIPFYDGSPCIYGYNLDGSIADIYMLPATANYYRRINEIEAMYYNFDTDIIGITFISSAYSYQGITFADTSITKAIEIRTVSSVETWLRDEVTLTVKEHDYSSLEPSWILGYYKSINDALANAQYMHGRKTITVSGDSITSRVNLYGLKNADVYYLDCDAISVKGCNDVSLLSPTLNGSTTLTSLTCQIHVWNSTGIVIYGGTFNNSSSIYGIVSYQGSDVTVESCTFSDSDMNGVSYYGGSFKNGRFKSIANSGINKKVSLYDGYSTVGTAFTLSDSISHYNTLIIGIQAGSRKYTYNLASLSIFQADTTFESSGTLYNIKAIFSKTSDTSLTLTYCKQGAIGSTYSDRSSIYVSVEGFND